MNAVTDADRRDGGTGEQGQCPPAPLILADQLSLFQPEGSRLCLPYAYSPLPQIIRPSAVLVTDHGSAAEEGKNQSNSILLAANIPHALPALNIRNTNVKRLKKLVENWKKCPHSEHLLDDEKGTTEKNSTLLHCVSPGIIVFVIVVGHR